MQDGEIKTLKDRLRKDFPDLSDLPDEDIEVLEQQPEQGRLGKGVIEFLGKTKDFVVFVAKSGVRIVKVFIIFCGVLSAMEIAGAFLMPDTTPTAREICSAARRIVVRSAQQVADAFDQEQSGAPERLVAYKPSWEDRLPGDEDLQVAKQTFHSTDATTLADYDFLPASGLSETVVSSTSPTFRGKNTIIGGGIC